MFITAGPIIKLCAGGEGDSEGRAMRYNEPRLDDDAFYLFLQKQKIALTPYTPPLGTSPHTKRKENKHM